MLSTKTIMIVLALSLGVALGMVYGWVIQPVEYTNITPEVLRDDYRADFVLMVAEAYQYDFDSETAARRLALLGSDSPAAIVGSTLEYARLNTFTPDEISALQSLLTSMQTYQPDNP